MKNVLFAVVLALGAVSCGGPDSFSCNNADLKVCLTISVPAGVTLSNKTCTNSTLVDSCATAALAGKCTANAQITVAGSTVTQTTVTNWYTGADLTAAQTACTTASGTWTTP